MISQYRWQNKLLIKYYKLFRKYQDHFVKVKIKIIQILFYLIVIILKMNHKVNGHQVISVQEIQINFKKYFQLENLMINFNLCLMVLDQ